ncbi:hypothetical protein [Novosphingobium sp. JCM 18896]|uniref:hypothetical protein n=1 Tax=Novosphingobium sp. JCM 18896 TaxID=2989731 RepID=UPI0022213365|nr:hypothetical protein [Novosphingobium sp. JCM 18896]MCW1427524.1 hypothetical protein [Novosphingobium sp. JCM 18896]
MSIRDENATIDRQALAQEVIVSAGNVLRAAGFGREEIGFFFRQAADMLDGAAPPAPKSPAASVGGLAQVAAQFAGSSAVRELHRLGVEGQALLPLTGESPQLKQGFDTAMQIVPLLAEAQSALRGLAEEVGLPLCATRAEAEQAQADVVCLETFETAYDEALALLRAVIEALIERRDGEAFAFLLGHFAENGVIICGPLEAVVAQGARTFVG